MAHLPTPDPQAVQSRAGAESGVEVKYRVIHPYTSYAYDSPIQIPVGTVGEWFEQANAYLFHVGDKAVPVSKWAVETWHEYFESVEE